MSDDFMSRMERRDHELAEKLREAVMQVAADYTDCDLLEPMSDIICELHSRGMLSASGLVDVLDQWLAEGAHWPPNTGQ
jgi:hypothetical protein